MNSQANNGSGSERFVCVPAVASELPIAHVLSQIRPVEEVDTIGEASEARFED